jgi:acetyl-CoA carboxylase biotin carboxylase subunit
MVRQPVAQRALFRRILVANRGEIALRVLRTARELGIETVAVYSDADRGALHVRRADHACRIGPPPPRESYLNGDALLQAAKATGCDAVHPGYGFLSENADFAQACADAKLTFLGPPPAAIRAMGDKVEARKIAERSGVPLVPGLQEDVRDLAALRQKAREIGYPVLLKAAAGGGGKGIRIVQREPDLEQADRLARAEAKGAFGDDRVYLEKLVERPRHVEIQVMADQHGTVVHYGERECSVQRRHQKLIEESPSMALDPNTRAAMGAAACALARAVGYRGAGTVEFLHAKGRFYFLEMNTRLQVEHPVTEMRYGADLVAEQIRVAAGMPLRPPGEPRGAAIEVRINAEDPDTLLPSLGTIQHLELPGGPGVRLDAALYRGLEVTSHYDSLLAKLIVHAEDRAAAIARMRRALRELLIAGVATTAPLALRALASDEFQRGDYDTGILERVPRARAPATEELAALAAALARHAGAGRSEAPGEIRDGVAPSPWTLLGRLERLDRPGSFR